MAMEVTANICPADAPTMVRDDIVHFPHPTNARSQGKARPANDGPQRLTLARSRDSKNRTCSKEDPQHSLIPICSLFDLDVACENSKFNILVFAASSSTCDSKRSLPPPRPEYDPGQRAPIDYVWFGSSQKSAVPIPHGGGS